MKNFIILLSVMTFFTVTIPILVFHGASDAPVLPRETVAEEDSLPESDNSVFSEETVQVFSHKTNRTESMKMADYIIGVVAAEMPAEYEPEALKAQALAAISYARYTVRNKNVAISTDSSVAQGYRTIEEMREDWGERFEENYEKIKKAVLAVDELSLEYDGQPILAAYFAVSSGKTENAADIWGKEYPYLISVTSDGDVLSPGYENEVRVTPEELITALKKIRTVNPSGDERDYIGDIARTEAGAVISVDIGNESFSGDQVRTALGLASPVFDVEYEDESFVFTTKGYGHGVGMSQYGADYMARQGADFEEILLHYYPGVQIVKM